MGSFSLEQWLNQTTNRLRSEGRPIVTLSYAQSLDGSISLHRGEPVALSGAESLRMTHQLRAAHDAILAGIGTIEADDPQLNVRLVAGPSPRPVILDSHLRTSPQARIFHHPKGPIIACRAEALNTSTSAALTQAGATLLPLPGDDAGHVSLADLLPALYNLGLKSVMVEGGAAVIGEFLRRRLVDRVALTIAPVFVGGLRVVEDPVASAMSSFPRLSNTHVERFGEDWVVFGELAAIETTKDRR